MKLPKIKRVIHLDKKSSIIFGIVFLLFYLTFLVMLVRGGMLFNIIPAVPPLILGSIIIRSDKIFKNKTYVKLFTGAMMLLLLFIGIYACVFSSTNLLILAYIIFTIFFLLFDKLKIKTFKMVSIVCGIASALLAIFGVYQIAKNTYTNVFVYEYSIIPAIIPWMFICAKYEGVEEYEGIETEQSEKIKQTLNKWLTRIDVIATLVHIVLFCVCYDLLEGHKYGAPDRFGDYARGLYSGEVNTIESLFIIMCIITFYFLCRVIMRIKESGRYKKNTSSIKDLPYLSIIISIILTLFVAIEFYA